MKVLLCFASNSGSTYLAAKLIFDVFNNKANSVVLKRAVEVSDDDILSSDCIIMGSPSWLVSEKEGQPHETISKLLTKMKEMSEVKSKMFAVFGCGDRSYLEFCGAVDIMQSELLKMELSQINESLKIDSFFFDQENNQKLIKSWAEKVASKLPVSSLI